MERQHPPPEPLLTYRENVLGTKRILRVFREHVEIDASEFLVSSARYSIPLATVRPEPIVGTYRSSLFHLTLWSTILWGIAYYVLARIPSVDLMSSRWGLFWAVPLFCVVIFAATVKPMRYANFVNDDGLVIFGFTKAYPDNRKYDSFLHQLSQLIREAREESSPNAYGVPPNPSLQRTPPG